MVMEQKNIMEINGVKYIPLSKAQAEWINAERGTTVTVMDDENKYGRFVSVWNQKQQEKDKKLKGKEG